MKVVEIQCRCKEAFSSIAMEKKKGFCEYWTCEAYDTYAEVGRK